jgi:hypothetical protein
VHLIQNFNDPGKKLEALLKREDVPIPAVCKFEQISFDVLTDVILGVLFLEIVLQGHDVRTLG